MLSIYLRAFLRRILGNISQTFIGLLDTIARRVRIPGISNRSSSLGRADGQQREGSDGITSQDHDVGSSSVRQDDDAAFLFVGRVPVHPVHTSLTEYRLMMKTAHGGIPENDQGNTVCLNWSTLISMQASEMPDFRINESNINYALYQDALQHFSSTFIQRELPLSSLPLTSPQAVYHPNRTFGRLVSLLADRLCLMIGAPLEIQASYSSIVDFLIIGMIMNINMKQSRHAVALGRGEFPFLVSQFVAGSGEITPSFAAFIDTLTSFWQLECRIRREAIWSPMPWSAESQREGRPEWSIRGVVGVTLLGLGNEHLDDDHWVFHLLGCNWGRVLNIPWLSGSHDGFPFCYTLSSYTRIRRDDTSILRCSDLAIWLSAMTFGLLEIISGIKIPETQLLRVDAAGGVVISGALILRFLFGWSFFVAKKRTEHAAGPEQRLRHSSDVVQNLHRALESLYECMLDHKLVFRAGLPEKQVEDIICSLGMFLSVLCHCVATIWEDVPECVALGDIDAMQHRYIISTSLLSRKRMLSAGWCPYTISIPFIQGTPIPVLSNIIHLDPFVRDDPQEHQHCTGNSCKFYTIDIPSYVPRHADDACSCSSVKPLLQGVTDLLAEDTIPVVVFDGAQLVVKRSSEVPYVAISHVWADGLGSTTEDGLPSCQIARVSRLARQLLPASGAFWMDSLCVPALHDLRKRAIKLMAKTYADADKVVVLDVGIRARCARANSWEENVLRIATSGWVTRVWTLQEGLLARQLYFEVADGIIESEELESFDGPTRSRMAQQFTRGVLPILEYRYKRKQSSTFQCTLRDVIRLLRRRTTTKPEDESIAIAGILPLDVRALLNIVGPNAAEMRMKAALLQLRHVPRRFPLLPQEKLALPGFKWAPCNLASALESDDVDGDAVCTEDGLLSRYTLVRFDTAVPTTTTSSITANATQFTFILSHPSSGALHLVRIPSHVPFDTATISSIHALIMTDDTLPAVQGQGSYCALVSMDAQPASAGKTEDVPLVLRYITPGEVLLLPFPQCEEDLVQVGVVDNSYIRLV